MLSNAIDSCARKPWPPDQAEKPDCFPLVSNAQQYHLRVINQQNNPPLLPVKLGFYGVIYRQPKSAA